MMEINRLLDENNVKSAFMLFQKFQEKAACCRNSSKLILLIDRFEADFRANITRKARELTIKNIKKNFEYLPKYSQILKTNFKNNTPVEKIDYTSNCALLQESQEVFSLMKSEDEFKELFRKQFGDYLQNAILKNIDPRNLFDKMIDLFCFCSLYETFRAEVFKNDISQISLMSIEPNFIEKLKVI